MEFSGEKSRRFALENPFPAVSSLLSPRPEVLEREPPALLFPPNGGAVYLPDIACLAVNHDNSARYLAYSSPNFLGLNMDSTDSE